MRIKGGLSARLFLLRDRDGRLDPDDIPGAACDGDLLDGELDGLADRGVRVIAEHRSQLAAVQRRQDERLLLAAEVDRQGSLDAARARMRGDLLESLDDHGRGMLQMVSA